MGTQCNRCCVYQSDLIEIIQIDHPAYGAVTWCADCISGELQESENARAWWVTVINQLEEQIFELMRSHAYESGTTLESDQR